MTKSATIAVPAEHGKTPAAERKRFCGTNLPTGQRVRIRRFAFGAAATLSCCTRGDGTSSNAPKRKPRMRTLSHNPTILLAWNRPVERVADFHGTNSISPSEFTYGASLSAQWPLYPAVREGMERALTRRKRSPAYELFPGTRRYSLRGIVVAPSPHPSPTFVVRASRRRPAWSRGPEDDAGVLDSTSNRLEGARPRRASASASAAGSW